MKTNIIPLKHSHLINLLSDTFNKIIDHRGPNKEISIKNALMSGYAIYSLKIPSLLQFEEQCRKKNQVNLSSLFGIDKIPSDTQMREIIDDIEPEYLKKAFPILIKNLQRQKKLEPYEFLRLNGQPHYLMPFDGTCHFKSNKINCSCCLKNVHKNGKIDYSHKMLASAIVHPNLKTVIPMTPEAIVIQDGDKKQDSEHKAFKRSFKHFKKNHPKMKAIICGDALYASSPVIKTILDESMSYILTVKEKGHSYLYDFIKLREKRGLIKEFKLKETIGVKKKKSVEKTYRFVNGAPLYKTSEDNLEVNFLECIEKISWSEKGELKEEMQKFSWVTNIKLTNKTVVKIAQGGRSRWNIENEVFNTLKNKGYNFEHNYGHGKKYLSGNFTQLMMMAFLIDQILEMSDKTFKRLLEIYKRKSYLWERLKSLYEIFSIDSWEQFYEYAIKSHNGGLKFNNTC